MIMRNNYTSKDHDLGSPNFHVRETQTLLDLNADEFDGFTLEEQSQEVEIRWFPPVSAHYIE